MANERIIIRFARNNEFLQVVELCKAAVHEAYAPLVASEVLKPWVAEGETEHYVLHRMGNILVAATSVNTLAAILCIEGNLIDMLFVTQNFRRQGLGTRLITEAERLLADAGIPRARLQCFQHNKVAISFYQHLGWHITETFRDVNTNATKVEITKALPLPF